MHSKHVYDMPRTTSTLPEDLSNLVEGSIEAGLFSNKSDAVRAALRDYFEQHENARVAAAVHLYNTGDVSLGKAARLAGVSRYDMPDILHDHGVDVKLGPESMAEAQEEIEAARELE
jgi:Arc/MetJ-type ribon-helix-helix transcriptional regulator